jgi:hypothetical protein
MSVTNIIGKRIINIIAICLLVICVILPFIEPHVFNKDFLMYAPSSEQIINKGLFDNIINNKTVFLYPFLFCTKCRRLYFITNLPSLFTFLVLLLL